jgi:antitoxin ParD1/3/4
MSDYHFPPDLQPYVDEMLKSGRYEHVSDLLVEAVYLHRDAELSRRRKYEELKKEIQLGLDQLDRGESAEWDFAALRRRVHEEVAKVKGKKKRSRK